MTDEIAVHNLTNRANIARLVSLLYDPRNEIADYLKKIVLDRLLWAVTENDDAGKWHKYEGQPYWSMGALRQLKENLCEQRLLTQDLRHEHAVPKRVLKEKLLALPTKDVDSVLLLLKVLGHAAVVSKDEDTLLSKAGLRSKMPRDLPGIPTLADVFSRYSEVGIEIIYVGHRDIKQLTEMLK